MDAISGMRITFAEPANPNPVQKAPASEGGSFTDTLANAMGQVESLRSDAQQQVASLLSGNGGELHSTMIAVEKADVAFQLMMQMRNKIVSAYEEVARMQF